jgi:hypothetical protein
MSRNKKTRPSKDQVRAWLTTVIAPVGRALAVESDRLERGNWSFRCETQDFEFLWPLEKMIAVQYAPNLEQFLRYRADLRTLVQAHDDALASLLIAARRTYEHVIKSKRFRALAASSSVAEFDRKYLAEYIVNGIRDLASYYTHHELWMREGGRFLDIRDDPALVNDFRSLAEAGRALSKAVDGLRAAINNTQIELSDEYRLPPVAFVDARA